MLSEVVETLYNNKELMDILKTPACCSLLANRDCVVIVCKYSYELYEKIKDLPRIYYGENRAIIRRKICNITVEIDMREGWDYATNG